MPGFAARLYNRLVQTKAIERQQREIAQDLVSRIPRGRVLDVGTGPGKLLCEVHQLNADIELFGLDISEAMVQLARENLAGMRADIRLGDIRNTDYKDNFFDLVTCTGSFYLWDDPIDGLREIFRILKAGCSAILFETYRDFNELEVRRSLKTNLASEGLARRLITPVFLKRQLRMTYSVEALAGIIKDSPFANRYAIEKIRLGGLPAWLRVELTRGA